jgi:hypothetical protein
MLHLLALLCAHLAGGRCFNPMDFLVLHLCLLVEGSIPRQHVSVSLENGNSFRKERAILVKIPSNEWYMNRPRSGDESSPPRTSVILEP